jgi:hypothetical protein
MPLEPESNNQAVSTLDSSANCAQRCAKRQGNARRSGVRIREASAETTTLVLVDPEDMDLATAWAWKLDSGYARRDTWNSGKRFHIFLHKEILARKLGRAVKGIGDHINGNRLDNRRSNLREATPRENAQNVRSKRMRTGQYRGVHLHKKVSRWEAKLGCGPPRPNGKAKNVSLGLYATPEEAAAAVDIKLDELGWVADRNFESGDQRNDILGLISIRREREPYSTTRGADMRRLEFLLRGRIPPPRAQLFNALDERGAP